MCVMNKFPELSPLRSSSSRIEPYANDMILV
jgi:hypothetical protein